MKGYGSFRKKSLAGYFKKPKKAPMTRSVLVIGDLARALRTATLGPETAKLQSCKKHNVPMSPLFLSLTLARYQRRGKMCREEELSRKSRGERVNKGITPEEEEMIECYQVQSFD